MKPGCSYGFLTLPCRSAMRSGFRLFCAKARKERKGEPTKAQHRGHGDTEDTESERTSRDRKRPPRCSRGASLPSQCPLCSSEFRAFAPFPQGLSSALSDLRLPPPAATATPPATATAAVLQRVDGELGCCGAAVASSGWMIS